MALIWESLKCRQLNLNNSNQLWWCTHSLREDRCNDSITDDMCCRLWEAGCKDYVELHPHLVEDIINNYHLQFHCSEILKVPGRECRRAREMWFTVMCVIYEWKGSHLWTSVLYSLFTSSRIQYEAGVEKKNPLLKPWLLILITIFKFKLFWW